MAKHVWVRDEDGQVKTWDSDQYPYCMYVECRECDGWFCNNGCDQGWDTEDCLALDDLRLFDIDELGKDYLY